MLDTVYSFLKEQWLLLAVPEFVLLACLVIAWFTQLVYHSCFFRALFRYVRKVRKNRITFSDDKPGVSVIICAKDEAENLEANLPLILSQDYPDYEVIVVDDASNDDTADVLTRFAAKYPNLHIRQVPAGAKFTSPKKFAVSLGIKAAVNDILLFTDADCRPASNEWISLFARNFVPGVQIVLGYGAYTRNGSAVSYAISYDTVTIALQYLSYAVVGCPYMGVGRNMAYRKSFFLSTRGFASHLDLQSGDDDLFVNEFADKNNTRIEVSPESATFSIPKGSFRQWFVQKQRHLSTAKRYSKKSRALLGGEMVSRALFYVATVACFCTGNVLMMFAALLLFLIRMIDHYMIVNKASSKLGDRRFPAAMIILDIFIPLFDLAAALFRANGKHYKWK